MVNDGKRRLTQATLAGAVAADTAALVLVRPHPAALARGLAAPHAWVATVGADRALAAVAGAALWVVAAWFATGLVTVMASRAPGRLGRLAAVLAEVALPRALTRLCAGALGASVLLAPAAAGAQPGGGPGGHRPVLVITAAAPASPSVPAPTWPTTPTPSMPTPPPRPSTPAPAPGPTGATARVSVRPGDSLWLIAARRLGPGATPAQISAAWRQWYAANRAVIGADPDLIRPGTVLTPPPDPSAR